MVDRHAEAQWRDVGTQWEADFGNVDIQNTKHRAISLLLFDQYKKHANDSGCGKSTYGLKAHDIAVRAGMTAAEHLIATYQAEK